MPARVLLWLALFMLPTLAIGQTIAVAPSAAQRCLTRGAPVLGTPDYPQQAFEYKVRGRVTVELRFTRRDEAPRVTTIDRDATGEYERAFEESVYRFVADYRVPCLAEGEAATLRQEFVFIPTDGHPVAMLASQDVREVRARQMRSCMQHLKPGTKPDYPVFLTQSGQHGTVMLRVTFSSASAAPSVAVLDNGGHPWLGDSASKFAAQYRLPCHDETGDVDFLQFYVYRIEGSGSVVLKDMSLLTPLHYLKDIDKANVYFDFNSMGCPFDVQFSPLQPHAPNAIGEVGSSNPERRFFLDWLSRQQLRLSHRNLNAVLGQDAIVSVPCTVLNLGNRSGGTASQ